MKLSGVVHRTKFGLIGIIMLGAVGVPALALVYFVGSWGYSFGYELMDPQGYWENEVVKSEIRFKRQTDSFSSCEDKAAIAKSLAPDLYVTFVKQGMTSNDAKELAQAWQNGVGRQCIKPLIKVIEEGQELNKAKGQLAKAQSH